MKDGPMTAICMEVEPLDWPGMVAIEPRLQDLVEDAARYVGIGRNTWANWSALKRRLVRLVGWGADLGALATPEYYEIAYRRLLRAWIGCAEETPEICRPGSTGIVATPLERATT